MADEGNIYIYIYAQLQEQPHFVALASACDSDPAGLSAECDDMKTVKRLRKLQEKRALTDANILDAALMNCKLNRSSLPDKVRELQCAWKFVG